MFRLRSFCGAVLVGSIAALTFAQEKAEPKASDKTVPRGFRMFLVTDARFEKTDERNRVGKLHDPITEHGLFPVVAIWSRGVPTNKEDPAVKSLQKIEELAKKFETRRVGAFCAFLVAKKAFEDDDDRQKYEVEVNNITCDLKFTQIGFAEEQSAQNDAWQLDAKGEDMTFKNQTTVIIYNRFKIANRFEFPADKPPTEDDLNKIVAALDVVLGRKPTDPVKMEPKKVEPEKKEEPKKEPEKKEDTEKK